MKSEGNIKKIGWLASLAALWLLFRTKPAVAEPGPEVQVVSLNWN